MNKRRRYGNVRLRLAREAARLMYEERYEHYFDAKRVALRRLYGRPGARFRPHLLPSNGEIREALLELADLTEGHTRRDRLFAMRVIALNTMKALNTFSPGLIGSVASGHVRRGSDIDIHVFTESVERLERRVHALGWGYELSTSLIQKGGAFLEYTHVHVVDAFPIELSVYDPRELRVVSRSSTDGKPIRRLKQRDVRLLLEQEHAESWADYLSEGELQDLERFDKDAWVETLADAEEGLLRPTGFI